MKKVTFSAIFIRQWIVTTEITDDKIASRNSAGQHISHQFDEIKSVSKYQDMLVIVYKDKDVLYMDLNGFKSGSADNAIEHIVTTAGVKLKDEER